jgi:DNA-directed RNA polymerase specialized sigma24 family protein
MRRADRCADTFSELYRRTRVDVLAFLLRRCSSAEDAADCLAETYLLAWKKRDEMPGGAETRPWLFGVARNVMRRGNELRDRTAAAASALAAEVQRAGAVCPGPNGAEPDPVTAAIRCLPELDREIITMLIWDELAPREVAAVLGLTPNVVRVRAHRARAKLRSALFNQQPDGGPKPELTLGLPPPVR